MKKGPGPSLSRGPLGELGLGGVGFPRHETWNPACAKSPYEDATSTELLPVLFNGSPPSWGVYCAEGPNPPGLPAARDRRHRRAAPAARITL